MKFLCSVVGQNAYNITHSRPFGDVINVTATPAIGLMFAEFRGCQFGPPFKYAPVHLPVYAPELTVQKIFHSVIRIRFLWHWRTSHLQVESS